MKILVILPNWLGDAVMATPAIELLANKYPNASFTFIGSFVSIEAIKWHPKCEKAIVDETKKAKNRLIATYKLAKRVGKFDLAISFRNHFYSSLLLKFTNSSTTIAKSSWHSKPLLSKTPKIHTTQHLVKQYSELAMMDQISDSDKIGPLSLHIKAKKYNKQMLGINAGATYGSAKRWYPERFAEVAAYFSNKYDILIFGGPNEIEMSKEIQSNLEQRGVDNYLNLAGQTSIEEVCSKIGGCSLFITNDSGPMHVAAAYQVPTVAIFGPTKYKETSQWKNRKSKIVRHEMECSPCMRRECPLGHHECMKSITAQEVIEAVNKFAL